MLDFSHIPNTQHGADAQIFSALGGSDYQTWLRPRGKSMMAIHIIGAGGGGGGGFSAAAGTARGGGGGGGSGTITRLLMPLGDLDRLYVNVPVGGLGGAAGAAGSAGSNGSVGVLTNSAGVNALLTSANTVATGGGGGTAVAAGAAGAAAVARTIDGQGYLGFLFSNTGNPGLIGGAQTGAVGASFTWAGIPLTGGMGGAGVTTADFAGGAITGSGWAPSSAGGLAVGGRGSDGWFSRWPFGAYGGTGGGSNNAGVGGAGGNGAIGCGGAGGGGGVTGGAGGQGGNGQIMITCW
jgi:hypothetical protein